MVQAVPAVLGLHSGVQGAASPRLHHCQGLSGLMQQAGPHATSHMAVT